MLEREHLGSDLDVTVVVQGRHPVLPGRHGGQQVGDAHRAVPPGPGQGALRLEGTSPVDVVGREVLVRLAAVGPHLLVLGAAARTVERLGIQGCTGGHQTAGDQRLQPVGDGGQPHPGRGAGVDEEAGDHRPTSARSAGSVNASSPPSRSQAT